MNPLKLPLDPFQRLLKDREHRNAPHIPVDYGVVFRCQPVSRAPIRRSLRNPMFDRLRARDGLTLFELWERRFWTCKNEDPENGT